MTGASETKGPSKGELKKLAKKAEKKAAKQAQESAPPNDTPNINTHSTVQNTPVVSPCIAPKAYYLAHVSKDDTASLKSSIAGQIFKLPLRRFPNSASLGVLSPLLHGPVLLSSSSTSFASSTVAFGGNAIAKAIGLLSEEAIDFDPVVDDWLEFERTNLRNGRSRDAALKKIEDSLVASGGCFLVGKKISAADIAVVVTLTLLATTDRLLIFLDSRLVAYVQMGNHQPFCSFSTL